MAKQRRFLSNLAFLLFVNILVKPFWILGVDRTVQNQIGPEEYGPYFALLNLSFFFNIVLDFGINNFNNRAIARHDSLVEKLLPSLFSLKVILGFGYVFISLLAAIFLGYSGDALFIFCFLLINQILISFILYFRSNVAALHHFRLDAIISVIDKLLMIGLVGFMLWGSILPEGINIRWFVYGQTAAYLLTAIFAFGVVKYLRSDLKLRWENNMFKRLLRMAFPFALLGLLMTIYHRIDGVMIERLLPETGAIENGIYAASYRLLDALNMIGFAFASILLPMFARMQKKKQDIQPLLKQSFKAIMFLAISAIVVSFSFRHQIMDLLYTNYTVYWGQIFGVLMISFAGVATMYIYGSLLTGGGYLRELNYIGVGGVVLNIVLNLILIPAYQAMGATVATVITQILVAAAHIFVARKAFKIAWGKMIAPVNLLYFVYAVLIGYGTLQIPVDWMVQIAILVGTLAIGGILMRMVDVLAEWHRWRQPNE